MFCFSFYRKAVSLDQTSRPALCWLGVTRYFPLTSITGSYFSPDWNWRCCFHRCSRAETVARWDVADPLTHSPNNPSFLLLSCSHIYFQLIMNCEIVLFGKCFPAVFRHAHSIRWYLCDSWHCVEAVRWQDSSHGVIFHHFLFFLSFFFCCRSCLALPQWLQMRLISQSQHRSGPITDDWWEYWAIHQMFLAWKVTMGEGNWVQ